MAQEEKAIQPNKSGKENLNPYYALVLLVLLVEGLIGYLILDRAIPKPEVPEKEIEITEDKSWKDPIYYEEFKQIIVEPSSERGKSMVRLSLVIEINSQVVFDELVMRHTVIWDLILNYLEMLREADFRDPQKLKIKNGLIKTLNANLKNPGVLRVFITDIILQ